MADRRKGSLTIGWTLLWSQLRSAPSIVLTIFVAALLAGFFLAVTPRLFERVSNDALREAVTTPPPSQRNISVERVTRIGAGSFDDTFGSVVRGGTRFADTEMTDSVRSVVEETRFMLETAQFTIEPLPLEEPGPFPQSVRLRYQQGIEEHTELVSGTLPEPQEDIELLLGEECPEDPEEREQFEESEEVDCFRELIPLFEVLMTEETLSVLSFDPGDTVLMTPDRMDPLFTEDFSELEFFIALRVSGVVQLSDPADDFWYGDPSLHRARITENADRRLIFATALFTEDAYRDLLRDLGFARWRYTWRYFVDAEQLSISTIGQLIADLRNLQINFPSVGSQQSGFSLVTRLPSIIEVYLEQRAVTVSMMSMSLAGLFATAVAVILLLAALATLRHRTGLVLVRNRGSSAGQMALSRLYQGLLLIAPAAVLAYLLASILVPETDHLLSYRATVALAAAATLAFVLAALPIIARRLGTLQRDIRTAPRSSGRRLVVEALVIVIALGSVVLLRRRGQIDDPVASSASFDPLLAAAPALLGLAIGLIAMRVYPMLVRLAAWLASKGRGLTGFVGFRRVLQQPSEARMPLLVVLVAIAVAVFASVARTSIDRGQEAFAWQAVGVDYLVTGSGPGVGLPRSIDLSGVEEIDEMTTGAAFPAARARFENSTANVDFYALEAAAYERVVAGTGGEVGLPSSLVEPSLPGTGTDLAPLPIIVSAGWPTDRPLQVGDTFLLDLGRIEAQVSVEQVRDRFPGLPPDRPFVVADLEPIRALSDPIGIDPTVLYIRAPESAGEVIASTVEEQSQSARYLSRREVRADVADAPLIEAVDVGLLFTFGLALVFAVVAAVSALSLASPGRRRDFGFLRTLGLRSPQATALTIIEQLPSLAVSVVIGVLLGAGIAFVLQPAIGLEAFTGGLLPASLQIDLPAVIGVGITMLAALMASVVIFVLVNRGDDLGRLLRVGDE